MAGNLPFGNEHAAAVSLSAPPTSSGTRSTISPMTVARTVSFAVGERIGERGGGRAVPFARVDMVLSPPGVHQTIQRGLSAIAGGVGGTHFGLPGASAFFMFGLPGGVGRLVWAASPWGTRPGQDKGKRAPVPQAARVRAPQHMRLNASWGGPLQTKSPTDRARRAQSRGAFSRSNASLMMGWRSSCCISRSIFATPNAIDGIAR